jgi:glycosyltransferase A (GT-A) superfamily protein (DUF2064 family)
MYTDPDKAVVMLFLDQPLAVSGESDPLAVALVRDTLRTLADVEADTLVFLPPDSDKDAARALLGPGKYKLAAALGRNLPSQYRNAFRLAFVRGYGRVMLLANAAPDLPAHVIQSAMDGLQYKCACLGPVPDGEGGKPDRVYAMGFDAEGYTTDVFAYVDAGRPDYFTRAETLILFLERKVSVLPEYSPVASLDQAAALVERCKGTRFAGLPSVRLAAERVG